MEDTRFGVAATSAPSPSRYPNHRLPSLRDAPHDARTPLYAIAKPKVSAIATRGVRVKRRGGPGDAKRAAAKRRRLQPSQLPPRTYACRAIRSSVTQRTTRKPPRTLPPMFPRMRKRHLHPVGKAVVSVTDRLPSLAHGVIDAGASSAKMVAHIGVAVALNEEQAIVDEIIVDTSLALAPETIGLSIIAGAGAVFFHHVARSSSRNTSIRLPTKPSMPSPRLVTKQQAHSFPFLV